MTKTPPKILLVGTSYSALPLLFELKRRGFEVSVTGCLAGDPGHAYADHSFGVDFSVQDDLLNLVASERFTHLIPSCNDFSYLACAWCADKFAFPGFDSYQTTLILHTKHAFREFAERQGFPVPRSYPPDALESLRFPVLVKPVDAFSGRGMSLVSEKRQLDAALSLAQRCSRSGQAVIEDYICGTLHSHSAFIRDGHFAFDTFADEFCSVYPYQVDCSNIPSILPDSLRRRLRECMLELVTTLDLQDGLLHTQFMTDGHDFWLIECMRRCPGDLYGTLVESALGVPYNRLYLSGFLGEKPPFTQADQTRFYARHTLSVKQAQVFASFTHHIPGRNIRYFPLKSSGEAFQPAPYDKAGILFAEFDSFQTLAEITPKLASYIRFETYGEDFESNASPDSHTKLC